MALTSPCTLTIDMDRDTSSPPKLKRTKSGEYRFSLKLLIDGMPVMVIKGFRIQPSLMSILPPIASFRNTTFPIAELVPGLSSDIIAAIRTEIEQERYN